MSPDEYAADLRRAKDRDYRKRRALKQLRGIPTSLLPADEAGAHVRRLNDLGWSFNALEAMAGGAVTSVTLGNLATGRHPAVERKTAAVVLAIPYTLAPSARVPDVALVPLLGARRRVHALMRLGWNHAAMKTLIGDTSHIARASYTTLSARRWRLVDAMYETHCMTPGPSQMTANRARAAGFAPPLAWDDQIDHPDARPVGDHGPRGRHGIDTVTVDRILNGDYGLPSTPAEKAEVCRRWVANGGTTRQLAKATGWKIERYLRLRDLREEGAA